MKFIMVMIIDKILVPSAYQDSALAKDVFVFLQDCQYRCRLQLHLHRPYLDLGVGYN